MDPFPRWARTMLRGRQVVAAVCAALLALLAEDPPVDLADFAGAGQRMLSGRLDGIYDSGWNQAGPLQFLISRVLTLGGADGRPATPVLIAVNVALTLGAMALCRRFATGRGPWAAVREAATGLLTLLWLLVPVPWYGHPAELAIPALWAYASLLHHRQRTVTAAVALGLSAAVAPWAVLGFPCLLAVTGPRRAFRAWVIAAVVGVACYLPFVFAGNFHLFSHVWPVDDDTLIRMLFPGLTEVTWPLRLVQAVLVAGCCAGVAYLLRGLRIAIAAAPAATLLVRVLTDPVSLRYYWGPIAVATVLTFVLAGAGGRPRQQWLTLLLGYLAVCAGLAGDQVPGAIACLVALAALLVAGRAGAPRVRQADTALTPSA